VVRCLVRSGARMGLRSALAFAEQAEPTSLASTLREALPASATSADWFTWSDWSRATSILIPWDLGFLPLALGLVILGFMLLLFQMDVDGEGGYAAGDHHGDYGALNEADMPSPRSRRDHIDLAQLTPRERRSLTCRLGEAYQRWNESEGQREAKLYQQRKRVARQAKLHEEANSLCHALREALRLAEAAVERAKAWSAESIVAVAGTIVSAEVRRQANGWNKSGMAEGGDSGARGGQRNAGDVSGGYGAPTSVRYPGAIVATSYCTNGHASGRGPHHMNGHANNARPEVKGYLERVRTLLEQAKALEAQLGKRTARLGKGAQSMPVWADKPLGMYDSSLMRGA